ncbi:MAG: lipopolysaccharide heptosyltransferase I [Phycisphaerae bacterium]|nr:MAG: lipopolysaccharide heptosyltransferase I [Phycisphaerae bacterium]
MSRIRLPQEPQNILIVKPSALGDIVHTLPVLHLLKRRFSSARISWMVVPAFSDLLEGHKDLDQILLFERRRFGKLWRNMDAVQGLFSFTSELRRQQFDLVIDLQGLFRSGWITWQTRAPVRVGFSYAREGARLFYTHTVPTDTHEKHAVDRYLDICESLGAGRSPVVIDFDIPETVRTSVRSVLGSSDDYAVLLPGTNWATKRWPTEYFEALIEPLRKRYGLRCVIAGGKDVKDMNSSWSGALNLSGKTRLKELVALLEGSRLVIANDSGPMHIAQCLGQTTGHPLRSHKCSQDRTLQPVQRLY